MWLSKRDFVNYIKASLKLKIDNSENTTEKCIIAFATSNNEKKVFDLKESIELLGYSPLDDSETFFQ